jgi:hypothetical protein
MDQQHVEMPDLGRVFGAQVRAQQVAAFTPGGDSQFVFAQGVGKRAVGCDVDLDEPPGQRSLCFGRSKLEQEGIARWGHALEFPQARPEILELPAAHGALFGNAIFAAGEHVEFAGAREQLYLHAFAGLLPVKCKEFGFEFAQPALGCAHEVMHRRIGGPHLGKHFLGGNAAVHDPDPLGFAVLGFDFREEAAQGGLVGGVAGHDFVGQRKTLGGDDQRDDDLDAIASLVARVSELAFVILSEGRVALEIGAREIVEQHFELHTEKVFPFALR